MSEEIPICNELKDRGFDADLLLKLLALLFLYNPNNERTDSDENLS